MTYLEAFQELKRLRQLIAAGGDDSVFNQQDRQTIEELYKTEEGKTIRSCNCQNKYTDAVLELYTTLKTRGEMKAEQKYQLKAGVLVWIGTDVYNHLTLTDELAEEYLKRHPDAVKDFVRIPEPETEPAKKTTRKTTKKEA